MERKVQLHGFRDDLTYRAKPHEIVSAVAFAHLQRSRLMHLCGFLFAIAVVIPDLAFPFNMPVAYCQDGLISQPNFDDEESVVIERATLSAEFANRISSGQTEALDDTTMTEKGETSDVELSNYLADPNDKKSPPSLAADFAKRLTEVEKQLKKRDEADAKKAAQFPTQKITGFLQLDTGYYDQTPKNIATVGHGQDGTGFRRARFAVNGKVAEFTSYQLEVDFAAAGRPSFFDNYVEQQNLPFFGDVRVGQFLQPFSVDAMSGFRNLAFLERSLPFLAFVPFRRVGIMSSNESEDELTHLAYSVFRTGGINNAPLGDSQFATDTGNIGGYSFSTRLTHLLYYDEFAEDRYLWHVGFSYDYSQLGANDALGALSGTGGNSGTPAPFYQAKVLPEFGPLGQAQNSQTFGPVSAANGTPIFADTGKYQANNFQLFGLETVYQSGAFSAQSEYMATVVESAVGPIFYQGGYAECMYRLTGEHRGYDKKLASLKNPIPFADFIPLKGDGIRGWGAWGVAARWSVVDLTNPSKLDGHYYNSTTNTFNTTSKAGNGILNDLTLGLNWYLNAHTKVQVNWIHAMLDNSAKGFSSAELFVGRVQVDF